MINPFEAITDRWPTKEDEDSFGLILIEDLDPDYPATGYRTWPAGENNPKGTPYNDSPWMHTPLWHRENNTFNKLKAETLRNAVRDVKFVMPTATDTPVMRYAHIDMCKRLFRHAGEILGAELLRIANHLEQSS